MMKKVLCSFVFACTFIALHSAAQTWSETVLTQKRGDVQSIYMLEGGDLIAVGTAALDTYQSTTPWVARFNADGQELWSQTIGTSLYPNIGQPYFAKDKVILSGRHAYTNAPPLIGSSFISAMSYEGDVLWDNEFEKSENREIFNQVSGLQNGNYIALGSVGAGSSNSRNALIMRLDENGKPLWSAEIPATGDYYDHLPKRGISITGPDKKPALSESAAYVFEQDDGQIHVYIPLGIHL